MEKVGQIKRLSKVAAEFNVGIATIINYLKKAGYADSKLDPNIRITNEMYEILFKTFNTDKTIKKRSLEISLKSPLIKDSTRVTTYLPKGSTIPLELFRDIKIEDYIPNNSIPAQHVIDVIIANKNFRPPLKKLDLSNCGLKEIPKEVFELKHLEELVLDNDESNAFNRYLGPNEITGIQKEIANLSLLKKLSIKNNKIKHLPTQIKYLTNLETLIIDAENITTPPPEIVIRGTGAIRNYFNELKDVDFLYECKLLIVGEGTVGKTSLLNVLTDIEKNFVIGEKSTEGIAIKEWLITKKTLDIQQDFKFNVWDFGGQEIYHSTHQFFLTKRSLYIFVTEATREDKYADFYYWLNVIKVLGNDSPVIIVLNKDDQRTKDLPISEYKKINPYISGFERVSCLNERRCTIEKLRTTIINNIGALKHIGAPLPSKWVKIRNELDKRKQEDKLEYINYQEYLDICLENDMDEENAEYLADYFHDLGVFLHFDDPSLTNTIFLNHEWVTTSVYKVLDDEDIKKNHGNFNHQKLKQIWKDPKYKYKIDELFSLMKNEKFELCFEISKDRYLAPQLLPEEPRPAFEETCDEIKKKYRSEINFEYIYEFMPKGILPRFIVKINENIKDKNIIDKYCYRYGVIIEFEDSKAIVKELYAKNIISILIFGKSKKELLGIIRQKFHEINANFHNLNIKEMVPCNCNKCEKTEEPHLFDYHSEIRHFKNNLEQNKIQCKKSGKMVNIDGLINDIFESNEFDITKEQVSSKNISLYIHNEYISGDKFEDISNSEIFNHSTFDKSFNAIQKLFGDDIAQALENVKVLIENVEESKKEEVGELFDSFNEEILKDNPKKFRLKNIWGGLTSLIPNILTTKEINNKINQITQ